MSGTTGRRVDALLVDRGFFESRARAQAAVMEGNVYADGRRVLKAGERFAPGVRLEVKESRRYASRGALKIERPVELFSISVRGKVVLDAGASTGGFTDYLLQRGARRVYAVDVGYGQLDWRLRRDERVVVMERTNVRHLRSDQLGEQVDLATADLSFISLRKVLEPLYSVVKPDGELLLLVKPQFEAGRARVGSGGVVRDLSVRAQAVDDVATFATELGLQPLDVTYSPIRGPKGNVEFWLWLRKSAPAPNRGARTPGTEAALDNVRRTIRSVVDEAERATRLNAPRSDRNFVDGGD